MFMSKSSRIDLNDIAIGIEITLISIVEGFALAALATSVLPGQGLSLEYVPYATAGIIFILIFWSQSVLHTVSFIRWPLSAAHMFLYFIAAFVQVVAYGHLTNPTSWFFWWLVFSIVGAALYSIDAGIIRRERPAFAALPGGTAFLDEVERRHRYEMWTVVLAAILFNGGVFIAFTLYPELVENPRIVFFTGLLQLVPALITLADSMRNFSRRCRLISELYPNSVSGQ